MRRWPICLGFLVWPGLALAQNHPVFFSSSSDNSRFAAWKVNYDANPSNPSLLGGQIYKHIKTQADSGARYGDFGQWPALAYKITCAAGACDSKYVTKAWTQLNAAAGEQGDGFLTRPTACTNSGIDGNYSREIGWQLVLMYDWLYGGLNAGDRTIFLKRLNLMAGCVAGTGYFRADDSDQSTGDYFHVAMLHAATTTYNSTINTIWADSTRKIGGYTATAADGTTRRNAIKKYAEDFAVGGVWPESTEYNLGTLKILCLAAEALRTAQSPTDNYPEVKTFCNAAAEAHIHEVSPGVSNSVSQPYQWGDTQDIRDLQSFYRFETCLSLAGLANRASASIADEIQDFCMDYLESSSLTTLDPYPRGFIVFDPTNTRGNHATLGKTFYAPGQGIMLSRSGWTLGDSLLGVHMPGWMTFDRANGSSQIDHSVILFGEFQLWKNGAWAITHPLTYGGPSLDSRGSNGLTHAGVAAAAGIGTGPREYRSVQAQEENTSHGYVYITGTQGGSFTFSGAWNMPPTFLMEHTRSIVYLPSWDVVVVHDRSNSKTPVTTGYGSELKTWMDSRPRKELYVHSPVSPTLSSGFIEWIYSGSDKTRVTHLLPSSVTRTIENEATVWNAGYYGIGSTSNTEKKYHTIIKPSVDQQWDTFLNVWQPYSRMPATVTLVQDTTNKVDGALITSGTSNRLLVFNARQGPDVPDRKLSAGFGYYAPGVAAVLDVVRKRLAPTGAYSLTFTVAGGSTTKALLFDLDTSATWEYTVNGGAGTPFTPNAKGVGVVDLTQTGSITLAVRRRAR